MRCDKERTKERRQRRKKKDIGGSQWNEQEAEGVVEKKCGWMREKDGERVYLPLIYLEFLLSRGKRRANRLSEAQDCL